MLAIIKTSIKVPDSLAGEGKGREEKKGDEEWGLGNEDEENVRLLRLMGVSESRATHG